MEPPITVPDQTTLSVCKSPALAAPISSFDHRHTVTVRVTDLDKSATKEYVFFRKLLEFHSAFFAAALNPESSFSTGHLQYVEIEESIDVFDVFYGWLYTGRLNDKGVTDEVDDLYLSPALLCKIWVFADFRGIPELGNRAIDMLHERFATEWKTAGHCIRYVYENTTTRSKLRKFLNYWTTMTKEIDSFKSQIKDQRFYTVEFLFDALPSMARMKSQDRDHLTVIGAKETVSCLQVYMGKLKNPPATDTLIERPIPEYILVTFRNMSYQRATL